MNKIDQKELRQAVNELHMQAEHTEIAKSLIDGTITSEKYRNLCYQLFLITDTIENLIELPKFLQRRHAFVHDLIYTVTPVNKVDVCFSTEDYLNHLKNSKEELKGHLYTHYLGWLYGGQMISKKLSLPKHHLEFKNVKDCVDYMRNSILVDLTENDAEEAKKAFEYTIAIYKELDELS